MTKRSMFEVRIPLKTGIVKKQTPLFVGREKLLAKLIKSISNSLSTGTCILIGGYRGVGKTRLVQEAIDKVANIKPYSNSQYRHPKPVNIFLDLGVDSDLTIRDILCDLTENIYYIEKNKYKKAALITTTILTITLAVILFYLPSIKEAKYFPKSLNDLNLESLKEAALQYDLLTGLLLGQILTATVIILHYFHKRFFNDYRYISNLVECTRYKRAIESNAFAGNLAKSKFRFGRRSTFSHEPISSSRIQQSLKHYFKFSPQSYIVVFDEIDKINPENDYLSNSKTKGRKEKVDELLGGLKSFFNGSNCVFIMVAGREMVDAYYSESGYTSVLYEGVFDEFFYVPTLLTDTTDGKLSDHESMIREFTDQLIDTTNNNHNNISIDRYFSYTLLIKYLTLHSWGNIKRISILIKDFIEWDQISNNDTTTEQPFLIIREKDIHRLLVSAKLYALFDINLGRLIDSEDDKLIVSSMVTILDAARFHAQGFSRAMLDRTVAGIDIHSEINLANIADEFINSTFQSIIRRTSNNVYPYRFHLTTDIEFSYLTKIMGGKSSAFEFALDSADPVRRHYQHEIQSQNLDNHTKSPLSAAKTHTILGDIYVSEQSYDKAFQNYSEAINLLKTVLRTSDGNDWRHTGGVSLESHYQLVQTMLKKGLLEEIRENNKSAQRIYEEAQNIAQISFEWVVKNKDNTTEGTENIYLDLTDTKELWVTKTNRIKITNKARHTSLIVHSILSQDFLNLKSGRRPTQHFFNEKLMIDLELIDVSIITKAIFLNLFSSNFNIFDQTYKKFLATYKKIIISGKQARRLPYCYSRDNSLFVFAYGQALYCLSAFELKKEIRIVYDQFKYNINNITSSSQRTEHKKDDIEKEKRLFFLETCRNWSSLIMKMAKIEGSLSTLQNNDDTLNPFKVVEHLLSGNRLRFKKKSGSHHLFVKSLYFLNSAAKLAKRKGKYSQAAHQYTGILLNWIALLEIFPWQVFGDVINELQPDWKNNNNEDFLNTVITKLSITPSWVEDLISEAQFCVEKSDRGAYMNVRGGVINQWVSDNAHHDQSQSLRNKSLRVTDVLNILFKNKDIALETNQKVKLGSKTPDKPEENSISCKKVEFVNEKSLIESPLVWFRSNISNYLLIFSIWERYCRYSILKWLCYSIKEGHTALYSKLPESETHSTETVPETIITDKPSDMDIATRLNNLAQCRFDLSNISSPPGNLPRAKSIFLWLESRSLTHDLMFNLKNEPEKRDDLITVGITEIISKNIYAIDLCRKAFRSDDPDTFPPKSQIYFHLNEIVDRLQSEFQPNKRDVINKINENLYQDSKLRLSIALDARYIKKQLEKHLSDLEEINNISSLSFRKKLRHKYYLYDDFEDTFFVTEWSYLQMLSCGSKFLKVHTHSYEADISDFDA